MKDSENLCTEPMEVELSDITGISGVANIKDLHSRPLYRFSKTLKIHNS